jgi:hypothetical protein
MHVLNTSNGFYIKLRNISQEDIDNVLAAISKHFKLVSLDIRKRRRV